MFSGLTRTSCLTRPGPSVRSIHTTKSIHPTRPTQLRRFLQPFNSVKTMSHTFVRPSLGLGHDTLILRKLERRLMSSGFRPSSYDLNMKVVYGIIGINVGVWGYYMYVKAQATQGHIQGIMKFVPNFTLNEYEFFGQRRYWQAITACFTHFDPMHLAFNLISAYSFYSVLAHVPGIGPAKLITTTIGAGLSGSAFWLAQRKNQNGAGYDRNKRALGFSGCVMGLGAVASCIRPHTTMLLMGIVPCPLWAITLGYMAYDGYYLNSERTRTAHGGHLGGLLYGVAYYFLVLRRIPGLRGI
ncbi:hypothetical protein K504DRAFT_214839 [Pleomassaria siparia CBS 279.74]|uniref:Peptidase S54 rhomboid domain-containing protein n=1 Tax=Pleomassaria siparia CBS 279.74 TaxID=1314801 RepID=A0A6G1JR41_9PLEO|nr:hypothetical protein K504DRAFT_214839 [Pleomassaria siparia CBS 279.74]